MSRVIHAIYDGSAIQPEEALPFRANTRLHIVVAEVPRSGSGASFLQIAEALTLPGPSDWSARLDEYLYGGRELPPAAI